MLLISVPLSVMLMSFMNRVAPRSFTICTHREYLLECVCVCVADFLMSASCSAHLLTVHYDQVNYFSMCQ